MGSCRCGNPLPERSGPGRTRQYCSDRCRKQAQREREACEGVTKSPVTKLEDVRFYCGLSNRYWSYHPARPGPYACVAPMCGKTQATRTMNYVTLPDETVAVLLDSSAFSDKQRLSFEEARNRQIAHAYRFGYASRVSHVASYDLLIDEKWRDGERSKIRWSREEAEEAVRETVAAAHYLARQRRALRGAYGHRVGLALSAQGVEVEQYLRCTEQIVSLLEDGDLFALGGWCITGLLPDAVLPSFCEIMSEVIPYLGKSGVKRVHIWGVMFPQALGYLLYLCDQYQIQLSTDSSGPERYPTLGQWGYSSWRNNAYRKPPVFSSCRTVDQQGNRLPTCPPALRCLGQERIRHVQLTREWLADFRSREAALYRPIVLPAYRQLSWMEAAG